MTPKISFTSVQHQGGFETPPLERQFSPSAALEHLLVSELGYGGRVLTLLDSEIIVQTPGFGCYDIQTFTGTKEDMAWLRKICNAHQEPDLDDLLALIPYSAPKADRANALLLTFSIGKRRAALALMRAGGVTDSDDFAEGLKIPLEQLIPAVQLLEGSGMNLRQMLSAVGVWG